MAQHFDVSLKTILRYSKGLISRQAFGGDVVEWLNVELPEVRNPRVDLLARRSDGMLRHVELQSRNEDKMERRQAGYYMGFWRLLDEHVEQVMLYAGREPLRMPTVFKTPAMRYEYTILNLREMDGEDLLASHDWGDNEFALLTKADRERVIQVVERQLRGLRGEEQTDAARSFILLSGILGIEEEVGRRLEADMIDIMENKVFGPAIRKGIEQGRREGIADVLRAQLNRRFGTLPDWADAKLREADMETLRSWSLRLFDHSNLESLLN